MNTLKNLNAAVSYIENNLCDVISIDEAARLAGASADSFMRFFSYMTGCTIPEYIRRRRMTLAGDMLKNMSMRIIDIALQLGYDSADAFSRAFFRQHGITPTAFRKNGGALKVFPPASFHITVKGAKEMDFRIIDLPRTELLGLSRPYDGQNYRSREELRSQMWSEDCDDIPGQICNGKWNQHGSSSHDGIWYGLWQNGNYSIARSPADVKNSTLESIVIPPGTYAAFRTERGGLAWEELPKLFSLIFDSWLPSSEYKWDRSLIIEIYHLWTDHDKRRKNRYYEVWIPVNSR